MKPDAHQLSSISTFLSWRCASVTVIYILTGFGVLVALLTSVAQYLTQKGERGSPRARLRPSGPQPAS
jgi:hypothetical protein